jgi:phytoene/squalene synthetase
MQKISSAQFCHEFVRRENYDLYLLHFFVPRDKRRAILAAMALHTEIRSIPTKVQDPMMRMIRLKWWMDEIEKIMNGQACADSPILEEITTLSPYPNFNDYFTRFDKSFRGEDADIDEAFYSTLGTIIGTSKSKNRFSKKLVLHDTLPEGTNFRAFRLWLGV